MSVNLAIHFTIKPDSRKLKYLSQTGKEELCDKNYIDTTSSYSYKDANNEKKVDLDGYAKYSDIRAIRGEGTVAKIVVYPNPSADGKLNVVFEGNNELRDVQVNDMQGRVVKSYKGITNNILVIERLTSGFYTIKITNRNTASSSVDKVVVK